MVERADVVVAYVLHDWGGAAATLRCARQKGRRMVSYSEGEILSTNVAVTTELPNNTKRRVTFHISTTLDAEKGDSGGPVLTRSGYKLVGILKARTELDNGTIVTALTRASEIKKKFYCETY